MFIEKSEICKFADDNTIYDCGKENLKNDMKLYQNGFE